MQREYTGSVLSQQAAVASRATSAGVATAKRGRASREKVARRENILLEAAKAGRELFAGDCLSPGIPFYTTRMLSSLRLRWGHNGGTPILAKTGTE